jgi:hypothetical protein
MGGAVEVDQASVRPGQTTARSCASISGAGCDRRWMRPAASVSRRMADQAGKRVDGAGPWCGRGIKLQPEGTTIGAAGCGVACRGRARRARARVGRTEAYKGGGGCRGLPAGRRLATSRQCNPTLGFEAFGTTREQQRGGSGGGEQRCGAAAPGGDERRRGVAAPGGDEWQQRGPGGRERRHRATVPGGDQRGTG